MTEESSWDRNFEALKTAVHLIEGLSWVQNLQVPMTGAQKIEVWSLVQNSEGQMNEDCSIAALSLVLSFEEPKTWRMIVEQKTEAHCYVVPNSLLPTTAEQKIEARLIGVSSWVPNFGERMI
jgi:hypothetical protein